MQSYLLISIAAGSLLALGGCGKGKAEPKEPAPLPVQTALVEEAVVDNSTEYSASIEADKTVDMIFKTDGYVDALLQVGGRNLQKGDFVPKGAVLARVRQSDYRASADAAHSQALQADENLKATVWQLWQAEAIHRKATQDAERAAALYEEKALTKPDYDASRAQLESTRAQVEAARKNIEAQRNLLERAQAQERLAKITLGDTSLVAPMAAVVLEKNIEAGSLAGRGAAAFRLGDVSTVRLTFGVPDTLVVRLKPGGLLPVSVDALPGVELQGRIREIAAAADSDTRLFRVAVAIPNAKQQLRVGMMGKVRLPGIQSGASLPTVPSTALLRSPSDPHAATVFAVTGGAVEPVAKLRSIRLGDFVGSRVTVLAGLSRGERVVTGGRQNLVDGARIRVAE